MGARSRSVPGAPPVPPPRGGRGNAAAAIDVAVAVAAVAAAAPERPVGVAPAILGRAKGP